MKLSDLGERKAIELISRILSRGDAAVGIGDDCAAIDFNQEYLLVSTDMISQKTHMPSEMTPFQVGWFIVAINLSDIAAKGGKPLGLVISIGLPKNISESYLKELMKGANACTTHFGTSIVGGDTKETMDITICGTAFGIVKKDEFMPRKGAKPGDMVAITGDLGKAGAGHCALKYRIKDQDILKGLLEPTPRLREGRSLAEEKIVSSCMDISDGLSSSLYQLQDVNHVGFEIDREQIPIASELLNIQEREKIDVYKYALHFGGDYELLVTIPADKLDRAVKSMEKIGTNFTAIGKVTKSKNVTIVSENAKKLLKNMGYEHFKRHIF